VTSVPPDAEVTAVIPTTLDRPSLLARALDSVRRQRGVGVNIVVAADVPHGHPLPDLGADVRVEIVGGKGAHAARNAGASVATTPWVAFLDDDDAWEPDKLRLQLAAGRQCGAEAIVASRYRFVLDGHRWYERPLKTLHDGQDISEYLFCAVTPVGPTGTLLMSSLLVSTSLVQRCPFSADTPRGAEDLDFLLRAAKRHAARVVQLQAPLVAYHYDTGRRHLSREGSWRDSLDWADANADLFTARSAAAYRLKLLGTPGGRAHLREVVVAAFRTGRPRAVDVAWALALTCVSPALRRSVASRVLSLKARVASQRG